MTQKQGLKMWLLWKNVHHFITATDTPILIVDFFIKNLCSRFYATRCIEDETLATRAISVGDNVVKVKAYWESLCKSKCPKCKSYDVLVRGYKDKLMIAKLLLFQECCRYLERLPGCIPNK